MAQNLEPQPGLKKVLSFPLILLITINSIMGTGIFFLPVLGARHSGPFSIVAWIVLSIIAIYISMCFAELVGMFPSAGGVYEFCKQAYGRFTSFIIGWATIIAGNVTIAMLVIGAVIYLTPSTIQPTLLTNVIVIAICVAIVFFFNYVAYRGMKTSAIMLTIFSFITLGALASLIFPGLFNMIFGSASFNNFTPFIPRGIGIGALLVTIFFIAETFFGWETATFLAEETKDAKRVMPKALIVSTIIIAIICILFVLVTIGIIPLGVAAGQPITAASWENFGGSRPLADVALNLGFGSVGTVILTFVVFLAILGSVAGWIVSAPRLILALCRDKLFPGHFAKIHPRFGTPYKAILFQTILTSFLISVGLINFKLLYETMLKVLLPVVLVMYSMVLLSVTILRYKQPDTERTFKVPFGKVGPIIVILFMMFLIVMWAVEESGALLLIGQTLSLVALGIPFYFLVIMYYRPMIVMRINNKIAFLTHISDLIFLRPWVNKMIFQYLGDVRGKRVYEYGCDVGSITQHIAKTVLPLGRVYASDHSLGQLKLAQRRITRQGHTHVRFIHDREHHKRIHPVIPKVDAVVSIGALSDIQDIKAVLKGLHDRLPIGGRIVILEYDRFFRLLPNVEWLNTDKNVTDFFHQAGFAVKVNRVKKLLCDYVFIYGFKLDKAVDVPVI